MGKYILKFDSHTEYLINENNLEDPNVSYCIYEDEVHYKPYDYSKDYLTFIARETGTFSFSKSIYYSIDSGETWISLSANTQSPTIEAGDKIMWRYANNGANGSSSYGIGTFYSTGNFDVQGNIISLKRNDNNFSNTTLSTYNFCNLFMGSKIVNAKNLILPSMVASTCCYAAMFSGCTDLIIAPELPATTINSSCYMDMFAGCTNLIFGPSILPAMILAEECYSTMFLDCPSLISTPKLPATTLANNCYFEMFESCVSLTIAPELPATTLANSCYGYMFADCTSLTFASELPATTLTSGCYSNMFNGCSSLTTVPELPATTLAAGCYYGMFQNCTSLIIAPQLPAIILATNCYYEMFYGCTSLTTAPELFATTLVSNCYYYMFSGCSNINYIKALFTTTPGTSYTSNWVGGVASTGTFVKNSAAQWNVTGVNGIPTGWTVQTATL